jgi:hypothetical protein
MTALEDSLVARLSSIEPAYLSHLLWCWAMLAYEPRLEVAQAIETAAGNAADRLGGRSAAAALWALADRRVAGRCSFCASDECVESLKRAVHRASTELTEKDWDKVKWASTWLAPPPQQDEDDFISLLDVVYQ